jgi:hypothetical protein
MTLYQVRPFSISEAITNRFRFWPVQYGRIFAVALCSRPWCQMVLAVHFSISMIISIVSFTQKSYLKIPIYSFIHYFIQSYHTNLSFYTILLLGRCFTSWEKISVVISNRTPEHNRHISILQSIYLFIYLNLIYTICFFLILIAVFPCMLIITQLLFQQNALVY